MRLNNFSGKNSSRLAIVIIIAGNVFFFNCTPLYLSSSNCIEEGTHKCRQNGDVKWLAKKSMDILITLDNSPKGQDLNPRITSSLNQFLKCIEAIDYRVGVISGVTDDSSEEPMGDLINTEVSGQVSVKKFISADIKDYKKVFADTISLRSGCSYPPYCKSGSQKPLSAVKFFMQKEGGKNEYDSFLRGYAPLAVIMITSSDEKKGVFSSGTTSQEALASVYEHYKEDQFIGSVVTDYGKRDDCIDGFGDFVSKGVDFVAKVGIVFSSFEMNPLIGIPSVLLLGFSKKGGFINQRPTELIKFVKGAGGYIFNICQPSFGKGLAYSLLMKMEMENHVTDECKKIITLDADKVAGGLSI